VHDHEQLLEPLLPVAAPAEHPAAEAPQAVAEALDERRVDVPGLGLPQREEPLAPGGGLDDQVAGRGEGAVRAEEAEIVDAGRQAPLVAGHAAAEARPAHADGVDLVDEDDALAAPL